MCLYVPWPYVIYFVHCASSFSWTPWHACPFNKNTAWSMEFPCCSPSHLEHASTTSSLTIHQSWTV